MGACCRKEPAPPTSNNNAVVNNSTSRRKKEIKDTIKVVILGDPGVGKTSLVLRFADNYFDEKPHITIGSDETRFKEINTDDFRVTLQIVDTGGQEKFRHITSTHYTTAKGAMVVFDFSQAHTFSNVVKWVEQLDKYCKDGTPIVLVGNKTDLTHNVSMEEAQQFAKDHCLQFIDTSAKNNTNVEQAFIELSRLILDAIPTDDEEDIS